jgi:uncharacterized membrane protein
LSNHKKGKAVVRPDRSAEVTSFEGIIPDPETLSQLEAIVPGCTERWMKLAESEITARQKNEDRITSTFKISTIMSLLFAFITSLAVIAVGFYCVYKGEAKWGAAIITGGVATVISAYWFRSRQQQG